MRKRHRQPRRRGAPRFPATAPAWVHAELLFEHITEEDMPWVIRQGYGPRALDRRRWQWLRRTLRREFHPLDRRAIELHYLDGCSYAECARRLKVHRATVSRRIRRTMNRLRREARLQPELWPRGVARQTSLCAADILPEPTVPRR